MLFGLLGRFCPLNRAIPFLVLSALAAESIRFEVDGSTDTFVFAWGFLFILFVLISHIRFI